LARTTLTCLVCFEEDYNRCHRTYVARAAHRVGAPSVVHLTAGKAIPDRSTNHSSAVGRARSR
jgi:hypothetical protein